MSLEQGLQSSGPNHTPMKIKSSVSFTRNCVMCMTLTREQDTYGKRRTELGLYQLV